MQNDAQQHGWRGISRVLLGFLAVTATALAAAGPEGDAQAAAELAQRLQQTQSLKGEFVQRLYDQDQHLLQESRGHFVVRQPGSFYWESLPPYEQLVVSDGQTLWVYDPDLEQVTVRRQTQQGQVSPADLLSGRLEELHSHYAVTREQKAESKEAATRYVLIPHEDSGMFARLAMVYEADKLRSLSFEDNLGQRTELQFSQLQVNPPTESQLFHFDIPPGVDVIVDD